MKQRLEIIDFLRGFSIFTIVLMHLLQSYPINPLFMKASSFGGAGVHIFILCSGFGLCLSYLNKPLTYSQFIKRRFTKVYLPYLIVVLVSAMIPFYDTSPNKILQVLSHLFFFKMFFNDLESSLGGQMWFISTLFQFYIVWFWVLKLFNRPKGVIYALLVSLAWATIVAVLGKNEIRVWNSFFLQYLWEFVLGIHLATYYKSNSAKFCIPSFKVLIPICMIGIILTGFAGLKGGIWKLYNDVPSMMGYLSVLLIIYKLKIKFINNVFIFTNKISYEWYFVHILVFSCTSYYMHQFGMSTVIIAIISLVLSYFIAFLYHLILKRIKII